MAAKRRLFQFHVCLRDIEPTIWRRIQVPADYTFWDLHVAIQDAMGWQDYHLHVFRFYDPHTRDEVEIGIPDFEVARAEDTCLAGWEVPIKKHFAEPGDLSVYTYDFGDGWNHRITLEAVVRAVPRKRYPVCTDGQRACPPEDCGGPMGYQGLLEIMRDPDHERYEDMLEWLGGRFDPEVFNPTKVKFDNPDKRWKRAFQDE